MIGNRKRRRVRTVKDPGNEEFYEYIKDLVHHPYVLKMKNIPITAKPVAISIVLMWHILTIESVNFLIWMPEVRQGLECSMIYFCMTGEGIAKRREIRFMQ